MDFFDRQDRTRRNTRLLLLLFALAVTAIVAAVNLVVAVLVMSLQGDGSGLRLPAAAWWQDNPGTVVFTSLATLAVIALASLHRTLSLRSGGGGVARALGGIAIEPGSRDRLHRRLYNVVEEMAIASGLPVPEVFVLANEPGINAFAAGFTPSDAAVAVTRGALEQLDRTQLQGVVAHEFSHILNGDMRLNLRLVGLLFGIFVIAVVGRTVLRGSGRGRLIGARSNRKSSGTAVIFFAGLALYLIGYIGMFFGRLIQAAVSRQREFLADASAVQFTRQTEGLAGALKIIAGFEQGSRFASADPEQISHMLFSTGLRQLFSPFATHPPITRRIQALDASFRPEQAVRAATLEEAVTEDGPGLLSGLAGTSNARSRQFATELSGRLPAGLLDRTRGVDEAIDLILALVIDRDRAIRERQLHLLAARLGAARGSRIHEAWEDLQVTEVNQWLPLVEMSLPALRGLPREQIRFYLETAEMLAGADHHINALEFAVTQMMRVFAEDLLDRGVGRGKPPRGRELLDATTVLLTVLAQLGHRSKEVAAGAYEAGLSRFFATGGRPPRRPPQASFAPIVVWPESLQAALKLLDRLPFRGKRRLLGAAAATVAHDGKIEPAEAEILRAIAASLHVPIPPVAV